MMVVCECCRKMRVLPAKADTCEECVVRENARAVAIIERAKARKLEKLLTLEDEIWADAWAH